MYKAIHTQTGEEIIILHPDWKNRIGELRVMDHADLLVCQGCRQPLRVKAGKFKRAHFAHKHLQACSLGSESPVLLMARAVLYQYLMEQFPHGVTVEKAIEGTVLPRPVDCWVETPQGCLAYWIVNSGIKLEPREAILTGLNRPGIQPVWVMLRTMLNEKPKEFQSVLLTPTERAFLKATPYDEMRSGSAEIGKSLHYLDVENEALITYRNLVLVHPPNWFQGMKKESRLGMVRVDQETGSFVHLGEDRQLESFRRRQQRLAEKRKQFELRERAWEQKLSAGQGNPLQDRWGADSSVMRNQVDEPEALPCIQCGQITTDYWSTLFVNDRKLCRCRECLEREQQQ